MPFLATEKRLSMLAALVDGNSVRGTSRMAEVNMRTVMRFGVTLGEGAQRLHNALARDLSSPMVESDEIWGYVRKKQARVTEAENAAGLGEAYTFVALGMPSRFAITWKVGKRDQETTNAFVDDLRARLVVMPKLASDGFSTYAEPVGKAFGYGVDYGQSVKNYRSGGRKDDDHRYEPPRNPFVTKKVVFGAPDYFTTSHVERQNGTMRHFIGRMRRLCYAFSKKPENHRAAVALAYTYYNLCWVPKTLRITPAMAIGVTDHIWELDELMDALLAAPPCESPEKKPLAIPAPRGAARELPNGRGFLRLVSGGNAPAGPSPEPAPIPPAAPAVATVHPSADPTGQLDLLSWRPRLPPKGSQLSLFVASFGPPEGTSE